MTGALGMRHGLKGISLSLTVTLCVLLGLSRENFAQSPPVKVEKSQPHIAASVAPDSAAQSLLRLPLAFEANVGQADPKINYLARIPGYTFALAGDEMILALSRESDFAGATVADTSGRNQASSGDSKIRMKFAGANSNVHSQGAEQQPGYANYFLNGDPNRWRTRVAHFARVQQKDVYPGIDVVFYGNPQRLEYDVQVSAHADPGQIGLTVYGAGRVRLESAGRARISSPAGDVWLEKPLLYQVVAGQRRMVAGGYRMTDTDTVGFAVGAYDRNLPLVIDPVLSYAVSGLAGAVRGAAVDSQGNLYISGGTNPADTLPTQNAATATSETASQTTSQTNGGHAFVIKIDPSGSSLVYATYLGGTSSDWATRLVVDSANSVYVTGSTSSNDFPAAGPLVRRSNTANCANGNDPYACYDAFAAKLGPDGTLVAAAVLGGDGFDAGMGIAIDAARNVYVAGVTNSTNFPTSGAVQPASGGGAFCGEPGNVRGCFDAFAVKLHSDFATVDYATYLGGSDDDAASGIAADSLGNAYITGSTRSANFPVTTTAFSQTLASAGTTDAFVAQLNPTGTQLLYSTYFGGAGNDRATGVALDSTGKVLVSGSSASPDFPASAGAYQTAFGAALGGEPTCSPVGYGGSDGACGNGFVAKFDLAQAGRVSRVWATYLGGSGADEIFDLAVGAADSIWVTGKAGSPAYPVTDSAAPGGNPGASGGAFLSELSSDGGQLQYSTILSTAVSAGADAAGFAIASDAAGSVFVAGQGAVPATAGTYGPATAGSAMQTSRGSFVMKFAGDKANQLFPPGTPHAAPFSSVITLVSSQAPAIVGQSVTFTATVAGGPGSSGLPTGTVNFLDGAGQIATATLDAQGAATFTTSTLAMGLHFISAQYTGDANFTASTSSRLTEIINPPLSVTTLTSSQNPSLVGQTVTITAAVTSTVVGLPTGTITFFDGGTQIGSAVTIDSKAKATLVTSALSSGTHAITAKYSGDLSFSPSTAAALSQSVLNTTTTTLASAPNPATFGQTVAITATVTSAGSGTPTGAVTFFDGGVRIGAAVPLDAQGKALLNNANLSVGTHAITAQYGGDANFNQSAAAAISQTVITAPTTTTLASSLNPSAAGQIITLTATVAAAGSAIPTGTVTFFDGGTAIGGPVVLDLQGKASLGISTLGAGPHTLTARYNPDANFVTSTSAALALTVSDFSISATPVELPLVAGQSGSVTVTVTPVAGSTQTLSFSCSGLPPLASCTFSPPSVSLDGSHTASSTAVIATTANGLTPPTMRRNPQPRWPAALLGAGLLLLCVLWSSGRMPRRFASAPAGLSFAILLLSLSSCGGGGGTSNAPPGTPAGTSTVTITATPSNGGTPHSATVSVIVR